MSNFSDTAIYEFKDGEWSFVYLSKSKYDAIEKRDRLVRDNPAGVYYLGVEAPKLENSVAKKKQEKKEDN